MDTMNKLPAKQFQKAYLRWTLIPVLCFVVAAIPGLILLILPDLSALARWIGGGLTLVSLGSLSITFVVARTGRKRYLNLPTELYQDELKQALDIEKKLELQVVPIVSGTSADSIHGIIVSPLGVLFGEVLLTWKELSRPQTVKHQEWWYYAFGKDAYRADGWTGYLVPAFDLVADLTKHYHGEAPDDTPFNVWLEEQRQIQASTSEWGKNGLLLLEKALYLTLLFSAAIGLGVMLELRVASGVGVPIGSLIGVIGFLVGFPLLFSKRIASKYLLNKIGFGHAKGKRHFFLPWEQLDTLVIDGKHLFLHFHEEQDGEFVPYTIRIAYDSQLIERIRTLQTEHGVKIRIQTANNEDTEK
jgi:hypothetical protein